MRRQEMSIQVFEDRL